MPLKKTHLNRLGIAAFPDDAAWTTDGSNIYRPTGNVGIGNNNPEYELDVTGDTNISGTLRKNGQPLMQLVPDEQTAAANSAIHPDILYMWEE